MVGVLQVGAVLVALEMPAQAYVDPGTGYVLLQVVGSMAIGALYYLRHQLRKLLWLARGKKESEPLPEPEIPVREDSVLDPPKAGR